MRIAYIAPYQGPVLVKRRPIVKNLSLAGRAKIERIARLLRRNSHDVEILSQGEVIERRFKVYSGFTDPQPFLEEVPVYYSSALPVRFLNGLWSGLSMLRIFQARHRATPYDVVLIYNLKPSQVICANYAIRRLGLPVILEYEDSAFVDRTEDPANGSGARLYLSAGRRLLKSLSGCMAVSPELLAQTPSSIPKLLLRGVVDDEVTRLNNQANGSRKNWVVFSGTHYRTYGLDQLIKAWDTLELPGWELHITGHGEMTAELQRMAQGNKSIIFHGLLDRQELARLLGSARIGINPHDVNETVGNVFAFKIIEYLAAGNHVITTPMGTLAQELESGITYMRDNKSGTIAMTLRQVIRDGSYERTAEQAAVQMYGAAAVSKGIEQLIQEATNKSRSQ